MRNSYRTLISLLLFCLLSLQAFSQISKRDQHRFRRAKTLYVQWKYDDAEKILSPLCKKYQHEASLWNFTSEVQMLNYYRKSQKDDISFLDHPLSPSATEQEKQRDSLSRIFLAKLDAVRPSHFYLNHCINTWRTATLKCPDAEVPSMLLRIFMLDPISIDSSQNSAAIREFRAGEQSFKKQNYADAISHYHQALVYDTSYYRAGLYLGDAYYSKHDYLFASACFKEAVRRKPHLQEPRKYLVDALFQMEAYDDAKRETIDALLLYPEVSLFQKLEEVAKAQNGHFDRHWTERVVFPNTMGNQPLNEKGDRDWMEYINGFSLIEKYCDKDGIIVKKNELTQSHYAEVFAWEYMLQKTAPDKFPFARKMQQAGYLDCYVLLSEYHIDFNAQYQHFAANNKERLKAYVELLMTL